VIDLQAYFDYLSYYIEFSQYWISKAIAPTSLRLKYSAAQTKDSSNIPDDLLRYEY
jgi:hypothetical protein